MAEEKQSAVRYHVGRFPPAAMDWPTLIPLIGPASTALARYEGLLHAIPNAAVLLSPLSTREAVLSSRIEGTQATTTEVLEYEAGAASRGRSAQKDADIKEVLNYRRALRQAEGMLSELPISGRLLRAAHATLMDGVRGTDKTPGEFRRVQNWVGPPKSTKETATFVPISPERLAEEIGAWERYIHGEAPDPLVQLAVAHAEFEALHPFLDGNGRLGRLLIPLFLVHKGILSSPMFYMSAYLESNREAYYERLRAVSRDDDWTGWVRFFLEAVIKQARSNEEKAGQILALYNRLKEEVVGMTRSQYGVRALDQLFIQPVINSTEFVAAQDIPSSTARRILGIFRDEGLVSVVDSGGGRRPGVYVFAQPLHIVEGIEEF